MFVGRSKTAAGLREIKIQPILRDILATYKAHAYRDDPDELAFPTLTGGRRDSDGLRSAVLAPVLMRADELVVRRGLVPLPKALTTHKLRHAFASILVALGEDPISVIAVGKAMSARHGAADLEQLPSGRPRWHPDRCRQPIELKSLSQIRALSQFKSGGSISKDSACDTESLGAVKA